MGAKPPGRACPTLSCLLSITTYLKTIPACVTTQPQLTTHSHVHRPDKLQEAPRTHGSQENQKRCSNILLLPLGQKVRILIFSLLCVGFLLHTHSSTESRACWAPCSTSWVPIPWALLHGTWNKAMSLDCA